MNDLHDLELIIKSQTPIILIETREEKRLLSLFARLAVKHALPLFQWSITEGLGRSDVDFGKMTHTTQPQEVLHHIKATQQSGLYLLLDFHPYFSNPLHIRLMKEIAQDYSQVARHIILVSHQLNTPTEIAHLTAKFDLRLPNKSTINHMIREEVYRWQQRSNKKIHIDQATLKNLHHYLSGLTLQQAKRLVRTAIINDGAITHRDLPEIMKAKNDLMNKDNMLSLEYDTEQFDDIAGLDNLKRWLNHRQSAFTSKNTSIDTPKGILLLGVQGGGKSLAAKAVAGLFKLPLLRMDFAALYNKYIGETEKNLRHALQTTEVMSPCVLWIDEIEKGIAQGQQDDGVSRRILGTLLTWMAEHSEQVFMVATSNDIEQLPPELLRKGRIDEIFFIDLPDQTTRQKIFSIHLRKRNRSPSAFDTNLLADASEGFSGAEIEQSIVSALYTAQANDRKLDTSILIEEIEQTQPLSIVMAEKIDHLRLWAKERTVPA